MNKSFISGFSKRASEKGLNKEEINLLVKKAFRGDQLARVFGKGFEAPAREIGGAIPKFHADLLRSARKSNMPPVNRFTEEPVNFNIPEPEPYKNYQNEYDYLNYGGDAEKIRQERELQDQQHMMMLGGGGLGLLGLGGLAHSMFSKNKQQPPQQPTPADTLIQQ